MPQIRTSINFGAALLIKAVNTCLQLALLFLLTSLLPPAQYGAYVFFYSLIMVACIPFQAGLPSLILRETSLYYSQAKYANMQNLWSWAHKFVFLAILTISLPLAGYLILTKSIEDIPILLTASVFIVFVALNNIRSAALKGMKQITKAQIPDLIIRPLTFGAICTFALLLSTPSSQSSLDALNYHVVAAAIALLVSGYFLKQHTPNMISSPVYIDKKKFIQSTFSLGLVASVQLLNNNVDVITLGIYREMSEVAVFRIASTAAMLITVGLQISNSVVIPEATEFISKNQKIRLQKVLLLGAKYSLILSSAVAIALLLGGEFFIRYAIGKAYLDSYLTMVVLCLGQLVNVYVGSVNMLLIMAAKEKEVLLVISCAVAANVVLNILLVPAYGVFGAALSTTIITASWNIIMLQKVKKHLNVDPSILPLAKAWLRREK